MIYVGIDPGKNGGLAYVSDNDIHAVTMSDNLLEIKNLLDNWHKEAQIVHIMIEKAQAHPGQGVTSMFNYGYGAGRLEALAILMGFPYTLVPPQRWQKDLFVGTKTIKTTKERALEVARRLFPSVIFLSPELSKKPHDGMVDALLIAEHCRRTIK